MTQNQKEKFKNYNHRRRTSSKKRKLNINLNALTWIFVAAIIVNGISYVAVKNDLSIKGFVINDLQRQAKVLSEKNSRLEVELMSIESYNNLAKRVEELGMVRAEKIDYIDQFEEYVAKK